MKPHQWRTTALSCKSLLSNFIWFNFFQCFTSFHCVEWFLDIFCDSRIHLMFWFKLDFFCDLCKEWIHGMILIKYLKHSKTYQWFLLWELCINIDEHGICCYDLVGVDSKTLISFLLFYFILFSLCVLFYQKLNFFWN